LAIRMVFPDGAVGTQEKAVARLQAEEMLLWTSTIAASNDSSIAGSGLSCLIWMMSGERCF